MALVEDTNSELPSSSGERDEGVTLDPDHPLMKKFQNAMLIHLKKQEQLIFDELKDLKMKVIQLKKEKEEGGEELYGLQREIEKQEDIIKDFHESCAVITARRMEKEKEVQSLKEKLKVEIDNNNCSIKKETELRQEKDKLTVFYNHLMDLKKEMESNIIISQQVKNKIEADKNTLIEEKKKQDLLMLRLTVEYLKVKHQITELDTFLKIKEEEKASLDLTLADANADLEALGIEQNNLMKAWQGAILAIKKRDEVYFQIVDEVRELKLKLNNLNGEIEGVRKASRKEMERNEELTLLLHKAESTVQNYKSEIGRLQEKENTLNLELSKLTQMLQHTEKDLEVAVMATKQRENERIAIQKKIEKFTAHQISLEDQIMNVLQSQITEDKFAKRLHKTIMEMKEKIREKELKLTQIENTMASSLLQIEQQNAENERLTLNLEDFRSKLATIEKEVAQEDEELKNSISLLKKKQGTLDVLNKQVDKLISSKGGLELSAEEIKILSLQGEIKEINEKCEKLKSMWIRKQGNLVKLTEERNEQIKKIDTYQKESSLLVQKKLKLQNELDKALKEGEKTRKLIENHHQKLSQLSSKLSERKENKEVLGKNNFIAQNDFLNSLKDAESEHLKIQSSYEELILERENIKEELLTEQRTLLSWEKKIQIVTEMKQALDKENSKEGEMCTMKGEIHRMQVRLGQLHQVQGKLASDMEKCVARREAITYSAKIREKKGTTPSSHQIQSKISLNRKIEELNRKLKIVALEIKSIENQTLNGKAKISELQQNLTEKQEKLSKVRKTVDKVTAEIAEKRMKKLQNLEEVVKGQQLVRKYQDMKDGRYKPRLTSEATLQEEMQKQLKINSDIKEVMEKLKDEFPEQSLIFSRIAASLEVKPP